MNTAPRGTVMQVAHVVRDAEAAAVRWARDFGAGPFFIAPFRFEGHLYRGRTVAVNMTAAVGCLGDTLIELAQPNDAQPSIFNEVLQRRGEGLHHYWLCSEDLDAEIARYEAAGFPLIASGEMPGVGRGAYVDTQSRLGCFVELLELRPRMWEILEHIRQSHSGWDGSAPLRPYPAF